MRILVISNLYPPQFLGGYELGCSQMVDELRSRGHIVHVLTSVSAHSPTAAEDETERTLELPPIYTPMRMDAVPRPLYRHFQALACAINPANTRAIGETLRRFAPDVVYLWNVLGVGGLGVLSQLEHLGMPWVWHLMDSIPRQLCTFVETGGEIPREYGRMFRGRYILCSDHLRGEIEAGGIDMSESIEIVPNWVTGHPVRPLAPGADGHPLAPGADGPPRAPGADGHQRTPYLAGSHLRVMTASGTITESKGAGILIEAAAQLRDLGFANFSIDTYGHEHDSDFRLLLHRLDVAHLVRLLGPRRHSDLLDLYPDYHVFAFPTWFREPFGIAPLEAAAHGCVPLVTNDCGYAEWAVDEVDCLKAPRSPAGFADRLAQVLRGDIDLAALGRRAQSVAIRDFSISTAADTVERMLADAAADPRPGGAPSTDFDALSRFAEGVIQALLTEFAPA